MMGRNETLARAEAIAQEFYAVLRQEVRGGNAGLTREEQAQLQAHYPVMMTPDQNPPELAATIYAERRKYPVAAILEAERAVALDAGCGYGSESFLFAACGARVVAVDGDAEKIRIARRRQAFFQEATGRAAEIHFAAADLDEYAPEEELTLTWLASVLAALTRQEDFLRRVGGATRAGGKLMVTDMNLWNPLFLAEEWRRRRRAARWNGAFAREGDFGAMVARRGRQGARYYFQEGETFDDVQFFQPRSLTRLLEAAGWKVGGVHFSGYVPPALARWGLTGLERTLARALAHAPIVSQMGYFYLGVGVK
jgi:SAM-dependent methyltransferase